MGRGWNESAENLPPIEHLPIEHVLSKNYLCPGIEPSAIPVLYQGSAVKDLKEQLQHLSLYLRQEQADTLPRLLLDSCFQYPFQIWIMQYSKHRSRETLRLLPLLGTLPSQWLRQRISKGRESGNIWHYLLRK